MEPAEDGASVDIEVLAAECVGLGCSGTASVPDRPVVEFHVEHPVGSGGGGQSSGPLEACNSVALEPLLFLRSSKKPNTSDAGRVCIEGVVGRMGSPSSALTSSLVWLYSTSSELKAELLSVVLPSVDKLARITSPTSLVRSAGKANVASLGVFTIGESTSEGAESLSEPRSL